MRPAKEGGLGVPDIAMITTRQQLQMLQDVARAIKERNHEVGHIWFLIAAQSWQKTDLPASELTTNGLFQNNTPTLSKRSPSLWWTDTLRKWTKIKWPLDAYNDPNEKRRTGSFLSCTIWWNNHPSMQHRLLPSGPKPMGFGSTELQKICEVLQRERMTTMEDFLTDSRCWPTLTEFIIALRSRLNPEQRLAGTSMAIVYHQLCNIVDHWFPRAREEQKPFPTIPSPYKGDLVGVSTGQKNVYFPQLRTHRWTPLLRTSASNDRRPNERLGVSEGVLLFQLKEIRKLRRVTLPTYHDVFFRMWYRLLPVGSRFWFLSAKNPSCIECPKPNCRKVETEKHCFYECRQIKQIWKRLVSPWRPFFEDKTEVWEMVLYPSINDLRPQWKPQGNSIIIIWRILCSTIVHNVWHARNRTIFDNAVSPSSGQLIPGMVQIFTSHMSFLMRHAPALKLDPNECGKVLRSLAMDSLLTSVHPDHLVKIEPRLPGLGSPIWKPKTP